MTADFLPAIRTLAEDFTDADRPALSWTDDGLSAVEELPVQGVKHRSIVGALHLPFRSRVLADLVAELGFLEVFRSRVAFGR